MSNTFIIGIDEAGRGSWAGPMTVGLVYRNLKDPPPVDWDKVFDSKVMSEKRRENVYDLLSPHLIYQVIHVFPDVLEAERLKEATAHAIRIGLTYFEELGLELPPKSRIIMDGADDYEGIATAIIKADKTIKEVSAASVMAKVVRDRYMREMDIVYPGYGFAKHKGYGTAEHTEALRKLGPSPIHRTWIKPFHDGSLN